MLFIFHRFHHRQTFFVSISSPYNRLGLKLFKLLDLMICPLPLKPSLADLLSSGPSSMPRLRNVQSSEQTTTTSSIMIKTRSAFIILTKIHYWFWFSSFLHCFLTFKEFHIDLAFKVSTSNCSNFPHWLQVALSLVKTPSKRVPLVVYSAATPSMYSVCCSVQI